MRVVPLFLCLMMVFPAVAETQPCLLCGAAPERSIVERPRRPLQIEVETALDLGRVAQTGQGGEVGVDPTTGGRHVTGGLADLGGMALRGTVLLRGEPYTPVLISLPARVTLRAANGGTAEVTDLRTDVSGVPLLNGDGELRFSFGGRLVINGTISGLLRGSIPISADYP